MTTDYYIVLTVRAWDAFAVAMPAGNVPIDGAAGAGIGFCAVYTDRDLAEKEWPNSKIIRMVAEGAS